MPIKALLCIWVHANTNHIFFNKLRYTLLKSKNKCDIMVVLQLQRKKEICLLFILIHIHLFTILQ